MEKKIIDYALECIEAENCLPTTKQTAGKLGVDEKEIEQFKRENAKYAEFVKLRKRFTSFDNERKKGFGGFKAFYEWYITQEPKCHYCGTTQGELKRLFDDELVLSSKFNATLHIEQKIPKQGYNKDNRVLACALCNNAKSDMISDDNFQKYFKKSMREFIEDLLSGKITNNIKGQIDE